jgi:Uma2 family endonuclease
MASLPKSGLVTYEEWLRMPEVQDAIEEVVDGEIRIMPPPKLNHSLIVQQIYGMLLRQLDSTRYLTLVSTFGLVIRKFPLTSRVPDLAVFDRSTMSVEDGYIHSAPRLAVEVLSPANTRPDRERKLADDEAIGIPEVWVISPEARTVEVLVLTEDRLRSSAILAEGVLKPIHFPHVEINIPEIWPN